MLIHKSIGGIQWLGPFGAFAPHWDCSNLSITLHIFLPDSGSHRGVHLWVPAQLICDPLYIPVSPILRTAVSAMTSLLRDFRRVVDFSVYWAFYLLLGCSVDFQVSYMLTLVYYLGFFVVVFWVFFLAWQTAPGLSHSPSSPKLRMFIL